MPTAAFGTVVLSPGEDVGGGLNPSSPVQYKEFHVGVEGMNTDTQVRNHLSPRGLVGFRKDCGVLVTYDVQEL